MQRRRGLGFVAAFVAAAAAGAWAAPAGAAVQISHESTAQVVAYWALSGSLGTSPVRVRRVPVPGPDCRVGHIEQSTTDVPPVSSGLAVDGAQAYYSNAHGVVQTELPAFAPV